MDTGQEIIRAKNGVLRIELENGKFIVTDTGTGKDIMLVGKRLDGKVVIRIAKPGKDVYGSDDDLIFNSEQNIFKIYDTKSITVPWASAGGSSQISVPHGLTYPPLVEASIDTGAGNLPLPSYNIGSSGADEGKILSYVTWDVNENDITFYNVGILQGSGDIPIKYYIKQETAAA